MAHQRDMGYFPYFPSHIGRVPQGASMRLSEDLQGGHYQHLA